MPTAPQLLEKRRISEAIPAAIDMHESTALLALLDRQRTIRGSVQERASIRVVLASAGAEFCV